MCNDILFCAMVKEEVEEREGGNKQITTIQVTTKRRLTLFLNPNFKKDLHICWLILEKSLRNSHWIEMCLNFETFRGEQSNHHINQRDCPLQLTDLIERCKRNRWYAAAACGFWYCDCAWENLIKWCPANTLLNNFWHLQESKWWVN